MFKHVTALLFAIASLAASQTTTAEVLDTRKFLELNEQALSGSFEAQSSLLKLYKSGFEITCNEVAGWDPVGTGFATCEEALNQILKAHNEPASGGIDGTRGFGGEGDDDAGSGWTPGGTGIALAVLAFLVGGAVIWIVYGVIGPMLAAERNQNAKDKPTNNKLGTNERPSTRYSSPNPLSRPQRGSAHRPVQRRARRGGFALVGGAAAAASTLILPMTAPVATAKEVELAFSRLQEDYIVVEGEAIRDSGGNGVIPALLK